MVSDQPGNDKPRDLFHKRVLKSYHKRQQIQQRMTTTTTTTTATSSDEDGAVSAYRDDEDGFVPKNCFRLKKNEPIDKSWSNNNSSSTTATTESSSNNNSSVVVREKNLELKYGFISMIGRRRVMEDAIKTEIRMSDNEFVFFAAYDGHGGSRVSHACRDRLHYFLQEELLDAIKKENNNNSSSSSSSSVDWEKVMVKCFSKMDDEVMRDQGSSGVGGYEEGGAAAAVVVMVGKEEVVVANCGGDCRAILCNHGVPIPLSNDHKIINWNGSRVQGVLATSRSIGDHCLKPFVIPEPEVTVYKRNEWDEFLVIATDGLWDVVSNEVACEVVSKCLDGHIRRRFPERDSAADAAALLAELAIAKGSKDNISIIVVEL